MKNLYYIMGKSASGKDTIYKKIKEKMTLKEYILYTTRPIRTGEKEGVDYHYISDDQMREYSEKGKVIESRTYQTVHGPWTYATIADEQLNQSGDILTVGTLESYVKIKQYYGENSSVNVLPIYIEIDEKERRNRALERERKQKQPKYAEMERRLKADNIDFSEENLKQAGITDKQKFKNYNLKKCIAEILDYINKEKIKEESEQER